MRFTMRFSHLLIALSATLAFGALNCEHAFSAPSRDPKISAMIQKRSGEWMVSTSEAEKLARQGKYSEALEKTKVILQQRKELGLDLMVQQLALADLYEKLKQFDKADQLHRDAIQGREVVGGDDDPTLVFPITEYADYLKRVKRTADAGKMTARLAYIEKQRTQPPKELVALAARKDMQSKEMSEKAVEIGDLYIKRDQYQRAIMAFNKAIAWNPSSDAAYAGRGDAYNNLNQDAKAGADFNKAIGLNPRNTRALFARGIKLEGQKKLTQALADFNAAIAAAPLDTEVLGWRAKLYQNDNRFALAIADYTRALDLDPNATWAVMQRGLCFEGLKEWDKARADFKALDNLFPDSTDYKEAIARVDKAQKNDKAGAASTKPPLPVPHPAKPAANPKTPVVKPPDADRPHRN